MRVSGLLNKDHTKDKAKTEHYVWYQENQSIKFLGFLYGPGF